MPYNYYPYQPTFQNYQQPAQQPPQIQMTGFISVRNIDEARTYPVAPGNSVTFKDENAPYVYTKTQGFSQLDRPIFERYRLVKEEIAEEIRPDNEKPAEYALKADVDAIAAEVAEIKREIRKEEGDA